MDPSPTYTGEQNDPLKTFVDRDKPLAVVTGAILEIAPDRAAQILVFHGVGGQGKTLLSRKIKEIVADDPSLDHVRVARVSLEHHAERDPIFLLVWLRNELAAARVRLLAFDLAYEIYRSETPQGALLPQMRSPWTEWSGDVFSEGAGGSVAEGIGEAVKHAAETLVSVAAEGVPFVGAALKRAGKYSIRKGREHLVRFENECLEHLYQEGRLVEKRDFERRLVFIFAKSLERWRAGHRWPLSIAGGPRPEERFLFLIDEYERALDHGGAGSRLAENQFDEMLRDIIASCKASLFIVFTRERLDWPGDWAAALHGRQCPLEGLARRDAEECVAKSDVAEAEIRTAIVDAAMVEGRGRPVAYPILLELSVQLYKSLSGAGGAVRPEDFALTGETYADKRRTLVQRLLRSYRRPDLEATLKHLAVARRFDRPLFEWVIERCGTQMPYADWHVLADLSLVEPSLDGTSLSFRGAVREALESLLKPDDLRRTREALIEHYERDFDALTEPAADWDRKRAIAADAVEAFYQRRRADPASALSWWIRSGERFHDAGLARAVESMDRESISIAETVFGAESGWTAVRTLVLASNLDHQSRHVEAETLRRRCLAICEKVFGPEHRDTAVSLSMLASNLDHQGRHVEAEPLHRRSLAIFEKDRLPEDRLTATSLSSLAGNLDDQGRHVEAEPLHRRSLAIREKDLAPEHRDTTASLSNLASNLDNQGRHLEAEPLHRRSLAIFERVRGPEHSDTATGLSKLASNLNNQGRHLRAEALLRRSLAIHEKVLGQENRRTATSLFNLGWNLDYQGRHVEAETLCRRAFAIFEKVLGPEHPHTATSLSGLAFNLDNQGRQVEADPFHRRAEETHRRTLGGLHPRLARTMTRRAANLRFLRRNEEACELARKAEEIMRGRILPTHRWWIELQTFLANCPSTF
ncbi:MAG: tetratricopeptide repeat protein [Stellaceae bacterium]